MPPVVDRECRSNYWQGRPRPPSSKIASQTGSVSCILADYGRVVLFYLPKSPHQDAQFCSHRSQSRAISLDQVWAGSEQRFLANAFPGYAHLQTLHTSSAICAQTTAIATLRETMWPAFLSSEHRRY